ncbi:MAG: hypothetical protein ACHQRM_13725 [Bacteroidia bacterium]
MESINYQIFSDANLVGFIRIIENDSENPGLKIGEIVPRDMHKAIQRDQVEVIPDKRIVNKYDTGFTTEEIHTALLLETGIDLDKDKKIEIRQYIKDSQRVSNG